MRLVRPKKQCPEKMVWKREGATYRLDRREFSSGLSLGGMKGPVDIEMATLKPGAVNWPYHSHNDMWEVYLVVKGRGEVRWPGGRRRVGAGDWFVHPPREPHQMRNVGRRKLEYYVFSDKPGKHHTRIHGA